MSKCFNCGIPDGPDVKLSPDLYVKGVQMLTCFPCLEAIYKGHEWRFIQQPPEGNQHGVRRLT